MHHFKAFSIPELFQPATRNSPLSASYHVDFSQDDMFRWPPSSYAADPSSSLTRHPKWYRFLLHLSQRFFRSIDACFAELCRPKEFSERDAYDRRPFDRFHAQKRRIQKPSTVSAHEDSLSEDGSIPNVQQLPIPPPRNRLSIYKSSQTHWASISFA